MAQPPPPPPAAQPPAAEPAPAVVQAPPAPVQAPAPAAVQTPEPPRVLAAVVTPAAGSEDGKSKGHGHAWGHSKHADSAPPPETPVTPTDVPVVLPPPDDQSGDERGNGIDGHGNDNGDHGNDNGSGSGHDESGGPKHSGD